MAAGQGFKTFATGDVLSASDVNGYLMQGVLVFADATERNTEITSPQEGQFAYLKDTNVTTYYTGSAWANLDTTGMTNPMTTTGDTIYSSSGSTPARLGIGSTGQVLTVAGGVPSWATPAGGSFIGCSLTNSAGITLTTATDTKLTWNTENYDTSGFHAGSSTAVIIPAGLAGKYLITGTLCFDANTGGQRYIFTRVNGTLVASNQDSAGVAAGVPKAWCFTNVVNLSVGDSIEFHAFQNSGGNLNVLFTGGYVTNVQVSYLGA